MTQSNRRSFMLGAVSACALPVLPWESEPVAEARGIVLP